MTCEASLPISNLDLNVDFTEFFLDFAQVLQINPVVLRQVNVGSLPSTFLSLHHLLVTLPLDAVPHRLRYRQLQYTRTGMRKSHWTPKATC